MPQRRTNDGTPLPFFILLLLLIALQSATILYMLTRPAPAVSVVERPVPCALPTLEPSADCLLPITRPIAGRSA